MPAPKRSCRVASWLRRLRLQGTCRNGWGAFGWKSFGLALAVLGRGAPRTSAVRQLVAREWDGEWALWTTKQDMAAWVETLIGSRKAPVTDSRFGNGREGDASRLESRDQDVAGGALSENETGA